MPDLMPFERMVPALLDRLTDDEPRKTKESRDRRVVSPRRYLESARNDLRWLLNSSAHSAEEGLDEYPEVARSVLNWGIPDLCGMTASGVDPAYLERRLRQAVLAFEPRLLPNTLVVRVYSEPGAMGTNAVSFEISGELWAQPAPESFYVKTEVDLETGQWAL